MTSEIMNKQINPFSDLAAKKKKKKKKKEKKKY